MATTDSNPDSDSKQDNGLRKFHVAALVSVYTGILIPVPDTEYPIDGVTDLLCYMTNDSLFSHQLSRAKVEVAPYLREAFPWLEETMVLKQTVTTENWRTARSILVEKYGEFHEVRPMHPEDHEQIHPIDEWCDMVRDRGLDVDTVVLKLIDTDEPSPYGDINWEDFDDDEGGAS